MQTKHRPLLPEPVRLSLAHLYRENRTNSPACVRWDDLGHSWTTRGCRVLQSNATHTDCACAHFGLMALMEENVTPTDGGGGSGLHVTGVVAIIICAVVVFCVVVSFGLGLDYCKRTRERQQKWRAPVAKFPCFNRSEPDTPRRSIYVPNAVGVGGGGSVESSRYGTPTMDHYMEIAPNAVSIHPRPQAGPQSACGSMRRKSTAFDHLQLDQAPLPPPQQQQQQAFATMGRPGFCMSGKASTPMSTPERPLLHDFPSATASPVRPVTGSNNGGLFHPELHQSEQHIYVEVGSDAGGATALPAHFQPIQIPILTEKSRVKRANESSSSSQSSGYYSGPNTNNNQGGGGNRNSSQLSPVRRLDMQDSQFI